jgi:hypothetical protein
MLGWWQKSGASNEIVLAHTTTGGRTWSESAVDVGWPAVSANFTRAPGGPWYLLVSGDPAPIDAPQAIWVVTHERVATTPIFQSKLSALGTMTFVNAKVGWSVDMGVAGGQRITPPLYGTVDGGTRWQPVELPNPETVKSKRSYAVIGSPEFIVQNPPTFVSAELGFLTLSSPRPQWYRTTNAGKTWLPMGTPPVPAGKGIAGVQWLSAEQGFVAVDQNQKVRLWETRDGGVHWQLLSTLTLNLKGSLQFASAQDGWALVISRPNAYGGQEILERTTNGGRTWIVVPVH